MQNTLDRNIGTKKARGRENRRIERDKLIDRQLRAFKRGSDLRRRWRRLPHEPFSSYLGVISPPCESRLTKFPMRKQANGKPLPQFKDLSKWFKLDVLAMGMYEYGSVTFNVHVHPTLEKKWADEGKDPIVELSERVRKEVRKLEACPKPGWEYAFVVEGWGKQSQRSKDWSNPKQVSLHIHGFAALYEDGDQDQLKQALERACGHGLRGYPKRAPRTNMKPLKHADRTYPNYLLKYERREDHRLGYRRIVFSREATQFAHMVWDIIAGHDKDFWMH